ncbi:DUF4142 domain-containing protein [Paracoccus sp. MC1862]|uniref:DUF4142 domain-containing protein n=1 Tax=Paracoccus sp. MC1862 TaxID=2760307 RepID=UPI001601621E|nr:DUF4142 domain-containing protein [Paracoccus sp. MC1862]MBB1497074.1 DUF4142 domain-containing protein [Paracoccus sp. MC1862]QQO44525.1 DUF4142 domain-containing protein [Paracoccus sp. MC1862]
MKKLLLITAFSLASVGMAAAQTATPPTDGTVAATPPAGAATSTMTPAATATTTAADGTTTTTTATGTAAAGTTEAAGAAAVMPAIAPQDFVNSAASGGMFEVQSSELALERSQTPAVQEFARMMIADHSAANEELKAVAEGKGLTVPTEIAGPPAEHMSAVQAAEGEAFDQTYMQHQVQAHEETIMMFQAEAQNGSDPDLRAFAEKTLPTLNAHLQHAQGLATGN